MSDKEESDRKRILDSVDTKRLFDKTESAIIEWNIDNIVSEANRGKFRECTVDRAPLRYGSSCYEKACKIRYMT